MSRLSKIVIGAAAVALVLCAGGAILFVTSIGSVLAFSAHTFQSHAAQVDALAASIADFELPTGYRAEAATGIAGFSFVSYAPGDGHSHIQFVQGPANPFVTRDVLEKYAHEAVKYPEADRTTFSRLVGSSETTIRGETVTLVVGEAINHDGEPFRTMSGVFSGKGGPAFVSVESPVSTWNQEAVDRFIASIR